MHEIYDDVEDCVRLLAYRLIWLKTQACHAGARKENSREADGCKGSFRTGRSKFWEPVVKCADNSLDSEG